MVLLGSLGRSLLPVDHRHRHHQRRASTTATSVNGVHVFSEAHDRQGGASRGGAAGPSSSLVTLRAVANGHWLWRGDLDALVASADAEVPLAERAFEVVTVDPGMGWVALRLSDLAGPALAGRFVEVGPLPDFAVRLAPSGASLKSHQLHWRLEGSFTKGKFS